jgi:hypothetical protein
MRAESATAEKSNTEGVQKVYTFYFLLNFVGMAEKAPCRRCENLPRTKNERE